eukprot:13528-Heterococcus_DN1.PRE.1
MLEHRGGEQQSVVQLRPIIFSNEGHSAAQGNRYSSSSMLTQQLTLNSYSFCKALSMKQGCLNYYYELLYCMLALLSLELNTPRHCWPRTRRSLLHRTPKRTRTNEAA